MRRDNLSLSLQKIYQPTDDGIPLQLAYHPHPKFFTKFWWRNLVHRLSFGYLLIPKFSTNNLEKVEVLMVYNKSNAKASLFTPDQKQ